jgi:hypothetical protein
VISYFNRIRWPESISPSLRLATGFITGATTSLEQTVESMQAENVPVDEAASGEQVGIRVVERVRPGDRVYRVTE